MKRNYADISAISAKSLGEWSAIGLSVKTGLVSVWATVPDDAIVYLDDDQSAQVKSAETEIGLVELKASATRSAARVATPGGRIGSGIGGGRAIPFYFPGDKVPHFRCPPGTRRGGKWTDRMGTDCDLGGSRAALSRIGQRIDRIARGETARGNTPSLSQRAGLRGKPSLTPQPLSRRRVRRTRNNAPSRLRQVGRRLDLNDRENQARARQPILRRRNTATRQRTSTPSRLRQFGRRMDYNDRENQARARRPILGGRGRRQRRDTPEALRRVGRRLDLNDPENQARARQNRSRRQPETRQRRNTPERIRNIGRRLDLNDPENFERARRRRQRRKPETRQRSDTPSRLRRFGREMDFNDRENQARARRPLFGRRRTQGTLPQPKRTTRRRAGRGRSTNSSRGMDAVTDTAGAGNKPRREPFVLKRSPKGDVSGRQNADRFIQDSIRRRGDKTTNQLEKQQADIYGRLIDINYELMNPRVSVEKAQALRAEQQYLRERNQELQSRVLGQIRGETTDAVNAATGKTPRSSGGSVVNAVAEDVRDRRSSRSAIGYGNRRFNEIASGLYDEPGKGKPAMFTSTRELNIRRLQDSLAVLDGEIREFENAARRHHPDGADPDPKKYDDAVTQAAIRRHAVSRVESAIEMRQGELRKARQREAASGKSSDRGLMDLGTGHPVYGGQNHARAVADLRSRAERNLNRPGRPATMDHHDYIESEIKATRRARTQYLSEARDRLRRNDPERAAYYGQMAAKMDEHLKWLEQRKIGMGDRPTASPELEAKVEKAAKRGASMADRQAALTEIAQMSDQALAIRLARRIGQSMAEDVYSREGTTSAGKKYTTSVTLGSVYRHNGGYSFGVEVRLLNERGTAVNTIGSRTMYVTPDNAWIYHNHFVVGSRYRRGKYGGDYIRETMLSAREAGFKKITVGPVSKRDNSYTGIAVWPRLGFELDRGEYGDDYALEIGEPERSQILRTLGYTSLRQVTAQDIRDNPALFNGINGSGHMVLELANMPPRSEFQRGTARAKAANTMNNENKKMTSNKPYVASAEDWIDILDEQWPQLEGFSPEVDKRVRAKYGPKPESKRRGPAKRTTMKKKK